MLCVLYKLIPWQLFCCSVCYADKHVGHLTSAQCLHKIRSNVANLVLPSFLWAEEWDSALATLSWSVSAPVISKDNGFSLAGNASLHAYCVLSLAHIFAAAQTPSSPSRIASLCGRAVWASSCCRVLLWTTWEPALLHTDEISWANLCAEQITVTAPCWKRCCCPLGVCCTSSLICKCPTYSCLNNDITYCYCPPTTYKKHKV